MRMHRPRLHTKGFTLIELMVTLSIFVFMTILVVSKYGTFNQSTLLTNTAFDVALTIHTAQTYGLSVKGTDYTGGAATSTQSFNTAYGIDIDTSTVPLNQSFQFFADVDRDGTYNQALGDQLISTYNIARGATISSICVGTGPSDCSTAPSGVTIQHLDITFRRPNPDALIYSYEGASNPVKRPYVQITLRASDGSNTRIVSVRQNGQISVGN